MIISYINKKRTPNSGFGEEVNTLIDLSSPFFDLSYSRSKKGEERSIKVLTSSPKTIKLNLQLIEEEVIIPFL